MSFEKFFIFNALDKTTDVDLRENDYEESFETERKRKVMMEALITISV